MTKFRASESEFPARSHNIKMNPRRWQGAAALVLGPLLLLNACSSGSGESNDTAPESVTVTSRKSASNQTEGDGVQSAKDQNQQIVDSNSTHAWVYNEDGYECSLDIRHVVEGQDVVDAMGKTDRALCRKGDKIVTPLPEGFAESLEAGRQDWQQFVDSATSALKDGKGDSDTVYPGDFTWADQIGDVTHEGENAPFLYGEGSPEYGPVECSLFKGDKLRIVGTVEDGPDGKPVEIAVVHTKPGDSDPCNEGAVVALTPLKDTPVETTRY